MTTKNICNTSKLTLNGIKLPVTLGNTELERSTKQIVNIDLTIYFDNLPKACSNDDLKDSICYESLLNEIISFLDNKSFKLIEHLCYQLYLEIKEYIKSNNKIYIKIQKKYEPLSDILESASFEYSDF